jgi:hypothetical protein
MNMMTGKGYGYDADELQPQTSIAGSCIIQPCENISYDLNNRSLRTNLS